MGDQLAVVDAGDSVTARIHERSEEIGARLASVVAAQIRASKTGADTAAIGRAIAAELEREGIEAAKPRPSADITAELVREMAIAARVVGRRVAQATAALVVALLGAPTLDAALGPSDEAIQAIRTEQAAARAEAEADREAAAADRKAIRSDIEAIGKRVDDSHEVSSGLASWLVGHDQCKRDPTVPCPKDIPPSVRIRAAELERNP